jgi:hypothetical protein
MKKLISSRIGFHNLRELRMQRGVHRSGLLGIFRGLVEVPDVRLAQGAKSSSLGLSI